MKNERPLMLFVSGRLWFNNVMNIPEIVRQYLCMDLGPYGFTTDGLLVPGSSGRTPRLLALQHANGFSLFLRNNLPVKKMQALRRIPAEQSFHDNVLICQLLEHVSAEDIWTGISKTFPLVDRSQVPPAAFRLTETHRVLVNEYNPKMQPEASTAYAILVDGKVAATCESTRENEFGAESYVYTRPEFRRRGLGAQVVLAWAFDLQQRGITPFYSYSTSNYDSQALSNALGLTWFMSDVAFG
jgi:GNAT superfamily N-acetyltransferase